MTAQLQKSDVTTRNFDDKKSLTIEQSLQVRVYLIKNKIKLKDLAAHLDCYDSQLNMYLKQWPMPMDRYKKIKKFCKLKKK